MKVPPNFAALVADLAEAERDLAATDKALTPLLVAQAVREAEIRLHKRYLEAIAAYTADAVGVQLTPALPPVGSVDSAGPHGIDKRRDDLYLPMLQMLLKAAPRAWVVRAALRRDLDDRAGSLRARIKALFDAGYLEKQRKRAIRLNPKGRVFAKAELAARSR